MLAGRLLVARVIGSVRRSDTHFGVVLTLGIGSLALRKTLFWCVMHDKWAVCGRFGAFRFEGDAPD
jgi:hypothetical protein